MGCFAGLLRYLLYLAVPLSAVLVFYHLECLREREEYLSNKFNPKYNPEVTDCTAELAYTIPTDSVFYQTGRSSSQV